MKNNQRLFSVSEEPVLPEFQNISVNQLQSLVNSSIDHIYIHNLNRYSKEEIAKIIEISLTKIRPQGFLSINIANYSHICKLYSENIINDDKLVKYIKNCNAVCSIDFIKELLSSLRMSIVQINYSEDLLEINLMIQKK
jgi:hypothetical protein